MLCFTKRLVARDLRTEYFYRGNLFSMRQMQRLQTSFRRDGLQSCILLPWFDALCNWKEQMHVNSFPATPFKDLRASAAISRFHFFSSANWA